MKTAMLLTAGAALAVLTGCSRNDSNNAAAPGPTPQPAEYNSQTGVVKGGAGLQANTMSAAGSCLSPEDMQRPPSDFPPEQRRQIVGCINAQLAQQVNAQLPRQIDAVTRLDRLSTEGPQLTYHYTVLRPASDLPPNASQQLESSTRRQVCAQAAMRQTLQMGGAYAYRWVDNQGTLIHSLSITAC